MMELFWFTYVCRRVLCKEKGAENLVIRSNVRIVYFEEDFMNRRNIFRHSHRVVKLPDVTKMIFTLP